VFFDRVAQSFARIDDVAVAPPFFQAYENAGLLQLRNQSKCRALRNANALRDIAQTGIGIFGKANENVSVVAKEVPADAGGPLVFLIFQHFDNIRQKKPDNNVVCSMAGKHRISALLCWLIMLKCKQLLY